MKFKTTEITLVGLFVAIAVIGVYVGRIMPEISILGASVPISFMPFISVLTGALIGKRLGAIVMLVYMILGLVGLPIFQDGTGGVGHLLNATFGFIPGFIAGAYVSGWMVEKKKSLPRFIIGSMISVFPIYIIGILYMWAILALHLGQEVSLWALTVTMGPFLIKDLALSVLGAFLASEVSRRVSGALTRGEGLRS